MPVARSTKQILSKIDSPFLDLVRVTGKEGGYWYFVYDDAAANVYETESVYVMRLNDMELDRWVDTGAAFAIKCGRIKDERLDPNYRNMSMVFKNMEK